MIRTFTEEQVLQAYDAAPELIKDALSGDILVDFIVNLQTNYGLHVDTAGTVSEMIRNTLLGIMDPSEFFSGLLELGMIPEAAKKLTNDLNTQIFIPIHQKMIEDGSSSVQKMTQNSIPVPSYTPVQTPSVSKIESIPAPVPEPTITPTPAAQTTHEIPLPTYAVPQAAPQSPSIAPQTVPAPIPEAVSAAPAPSVSELNPSAPATPKPPVSPSPAPTQSSVNHEALRKVMKEYGIDPYREPVDEK